MQLLFFTLVLVKRIKSSASLRGSTPNNCSAVIRLVCEFSVCNTWIQLFAVGGCQFMDCH